MAKGSVYEGKSFEEAVRIGLDDLGLSRAEATITMIEEGKGGFLGFGARPFRVSIMRRPGGAVREPEETRERRVSSKRDDRRGGRGGRDRDRGRDRDAKGGPRRADEPRREEGKREEGRRGPQPVRAEGGRGEEPRREGRGEGRDGRREGREAREPRGEREGREPRAVEAREGREGREVREVKGEGRDEPRREGRREGRRDERRDERPEARRPAASDAEAPAAAMGAPSEPRSAEDAEAQERRRRRRGRRGGRGRRREGTPGPSSETLAGSANGVSAVADEFETAGAFEPAEAFEERREFESGDAPVEAFAEPAAVRAEPAPRAQASAMVETAEEPAMGTNELAETSRRLTEELLRAMGFEATVTVTADGNRADVTAEIAKDEELLTGQKGEVRQALQHLLNRFLNRGEGSRYHLQLEINDFWQRRERELEALARSLADQAVRDNAEVVTDYLNSQERRIVHVTLKEDSRVRTFALGTGMIKRVAIAPADFPERTGEEDAG